MSEDYHKAREHFVAVLKLAQEHIGASIGLCEAYCGTLYWEREFISAADVDELVIQAAGFLDRVDTQSRGAWRLHAAGGYMLVTGAAVKEWEKDNLQKAQLAFEQALKLDRASTETYLPYFDFLSKVGKDEEAVQLAKRYLDARPDDMAAHTACARTLIQANRVLEAKEVLKRALAIDRGYYAVHFYLALVTLAQRRPEEILGHLVLVKLLADDLTYRTLLRWCGKVAEQWPPELQKKWHKVESEISSISTWPESSS
jgi:tetratricopeptide (TPR) repeat protein